MVTTERRGLLRRMLDSASGPLLSFVALFLLPLVGAAVLDTENFAFWSLIASVSSIALSLDFGGTTLLTSRYFTDTRFRIIVQSTVLTLIGAAVVGGTSVGAWFVIEATSFQGTVELGVGVLAIIAMTLAAALRSVLLLIAQAALIEEWIALRNVATAGHAAATAVITITLLFVTQSFWALPLGWLITGVALLPVCGAWFSKNAKATAHVVHGIQEQSARRFATIRTINTIVASALLQGDRWLVALIGGPVWLALYEIAWRFAALPRMVMQALSMHASADVAPLTAGQSDTMMRLVWRSTKVVALVGAAGAVCAAGAYFVYGSITGETTNLPLFLLMVIAFTAMAATAPLSVAAVTAGRPGIDLPYALVGLAGMLIGAAIAAAVDNIWIFFVVFTGAVMLSVPVFFSYAPKVARDGLDRKLRITPTPTQ